MLAVRLTPRGGRDAIDGIEQLADGRRVLKVRVRAAASEGEANAALIELVAKTLGVPSRDVSLVGGRQRADEAAYGSPERPRRMRRRWRKSAASGNPVHRSGPEPLPQRAFGGWARPHRAGG